MNKEEALRKIVKIMAIAGSNCIRSRNAVSIL